jgi:hypothetical protein
MSSAGDDPNDQPDGSHYNLFSNGSRPGLLGGQYAAMMANAPPAGMMGLDAAALGRDGTGLPLPTIAAPSSLIDQPNGGQNVRSPFSLYDALHNVLNAPWASNTLKTVHDLSQSMERTGEFAAGLGAAGTIGGAVTLDPFLAAASAGLAGLGGGMDFLGQGVDAGTSFLESIQQDNSRPLQDFKQRMETPGFYDLSLFPNS